MASGSTRTTRWIAASLGPHDFVARFGGDEFGVLFADASPDRAVAELERVLGEAIGRATDGLKAARLAEGAALLGQDDGLAALEMAGMGGEFEAESDMRIALTGAPMRAAIDASASLPHARGSYCFLLPTSPSILSTPE